MTQPAEEPVLFRGFADRPVPVPPLWVLDDEPFASWTSDIDDYFRLVGAEHADIAAEQLITTRDVPGSRPFDPEAEVRRYDPRPAYVTNADGEDNVGAYTSAFLDRLAHKAELLRGLQRGRPEPAFDLAEDRAPERARRTRDSVAGLPAADVHAVADELDDLARALSRKTGVRLPRSLAEKNRLAELAAAVDRYREHAARPFPHTPSSAAELARSAARVAALDTRNPHLLAGLSAEQARAVHALLPESAAPEHRADEPPSRPHTLAPQQDFLRDDPWRRGGEQRRDQGPPADPVRSDAGHGGPAAAEPAQARQEPARRARAARPGAAAHRRGGPAQPTDPGRAR
ncbi:hypothetical protein SAMN05421854_110218 [Amycolatopsis rubida]|uniref:Uncharacterized protein n=2 Tax=Amycolatopsis rubida TaxID=112413 RepID=A0A1I5XGK5_9PSEU|nr:hypothetical protein SAMN05421854_110218 [Amycolatopsis rubida]